MSFHIINVLLNLPENLPNNDKEDAIQLNLPGNVEKVSGYIKAGDFQKEVVESTKMYLGPNILLLPMNSSSFPCC